MKAFYIMTIVLCVFLAIAFLTSGTVAGTIAGTAAATPTAQFDHKLSTTNLGHFQKNGFYFFMTPANPKYDFIDLSTGEPTSYNWNFGDGSSSTVQNPTHTFPDSGIFNVTLTVSDGIYSDSITKTIEVG